MGGWGRWSDCSNHRSCLYLSDLSVACFAGMISYFVTRHKLCSPADQLPLICIDWTPCTAVDVNRSFDHSYPTALIVVSIRIRYY